jgi:hypothetical protein
MTSQLASSATSTPGGSNTQVQYNSSGAFAGDGDLTFDGTNLTVANPLYLPDGAVATPSLANTGDLNTGVYFPAADTVGIVAGGTEKWRFGSNELAGENLIINGAMLVAQRGTSFTGVDPADNDYSLDRWFTGFGYGTPADRYTISQVAATTGALLDGFSKAIRAETTTAETSPNVNRYSTPITQRVELTTALQLGYGAAGAKSLTVSFWARSSETGTHGLCLFMSNGAAANPQSYSVSSADTWEKKSVTFSPHTSTAISAEYGLELDFLSQLGTTADNGTQDTWGVYPGYTSIANIAGTIGKYIEITGVQLSVGTSATDFEHLTYADELSACQRYFYRQGPDGASNLLGFGFANHATHAFSGHTMPVKMRAKPTLGTTGTAGDYIALSGGGVGGDATTVPVINYAGRDVVGLNTVVSSGPFTLGEGLVLLSDGTGYLDFIAEL